MPRVKILGPGGPLLVSTDMHGNGEDFRALTAHFRTEHAKDPRTTWVILGDSVHGPDELARREQPDLYDYPDESWPIVAGIAGLLQEFPERVIYVLGNHDHGHVGGPKVAKFFDDEAGNLERSLTEPQVEVLRGLFRNAALAAISPCGALLCHGSPDDSLQSLSDLESLSLDISQNSAHANEVLRGFLNAYGQRREVTARLLEKLSRETGLSLTMVVHGHDREIDGGSPKAATSSAR